ncbi:MAG TPA: hypothetical protein VH834_03970 [Solirubrobacteraceae bacterium]|jgi:hypothetical protein
MTGPGQLLLRAISLTALIVGGIVATALTHAAWLLVGTVAGLIAAAVAVAMSVHAMLGQDDRTDAPEPYRGPVAALAAIGAVAVVLAIALPVEDSAAVATTVPDASAAAATVRAFLAAAVVDGNAYAACQYLAPSEQQQVAALAGDGQTCRSALAATEPSLAGIHSEGSLHALPMRVAVRDGRAFVATPRVMFVLRPATSAETSAFQAPAASWRIASGAAALLA